MPSPEPKSSAYKDSSPVAKLLGWIFTPIFIVTFFGILCGFHPFLMLANRIGPKAHKRVLDAMNVCILWSLGICGTRFIVAQKPELPRDRPLVFVSNHQSMYDIPLIIWNMREFTPKFIAKRELARGIPSISYALRTMGSAIIDRTNPRQALTTISEFGKVASSKLQAATIFPEGTRARDGALKSFKSSGFLALLKAMPENCVIVPMVIDGNWKILRHGFKPVPFGTKVTFSVLDPIARGSIPDSAVLSACEKAIGECLTKALA